MKKVRCIDDIAYFTKGKVYEVDYVDGDGDIWVKEDDEGDPMFMFPCECEEVTDEQL